MSVDFRDHRDDAESGFDQTGSIVGGGRTRKIKRTCSLSNLPIAHYKNEDYIYDEKIMRNPGMQKNVQKEAGSAVTAQPTNGSTSTQNGAVGGGASKVKKSLPTAPTPTAGTQKKSKPQTPSQPALAAITIESQAQVVNSVASKLAIEKQPMTNGDQNIMPQISNS